MKTKGEEAAEDEMVRAHHQLKGHEFEQTPEDSEGEGSLCAAVHGVGHDLSDWTTTIYMLHRYIRVCLPKTSH